jgi:hypothetical protein
MSRLLIVCGALCATACTAAPDEDVAEVSQEVGVTREHITGDVWHHEIVVRVGPGPNGELHLHRVVRERAPGLPRATVNGVMLMHGDFSTFETNFAPVLGSPPSSELGLAVYLAQHDVDVWGFDRRWASTPADGDTADFGEMGLAQELDDVGRALAIARGVRLLTGSGAGKLILAGFSRGGQIAYAAASIDAARPALLRNLKGLVPLDVYAEIAPEDADLRATACANAAYGRDALAAGVTDQDNSFFIAMGELALAAPDDPSPLIEGFTNAGAMYFFFGQTYVIFPATPVYHLLAPVLDENGFAVALRYTADDVAATWLAGATPHQSIRESADTDGLLCGEPPLAVDAPLARIQVPLFYLGAAGGYGDHGLYTTTRVSSTDVTTLVVRRLDPAAEAEDFGHGDLLFAPDAEELAWQPLVSWIASH